MSPARLLLSFALQSLLGSLFTLGVSLVVSAGVSQQESPQSERAFPSSSALAEGVSPEVLAKLETLIQSFVDDEEIVGAELLVIKNGRSILHQGFGYKDQEQQAAMGTGNVFCVRSMTKPLIGTAILMLVGEKKIDLADPLSMYLPGFATEGMQGITIEHLITHTSGMPMSQIMSADLKAIDGIQAVAEMGISVPLEFAPGTNFNYSDQGTDTLTAVIEVASGMPAAEFVRTRILDPLGMQDSTCVMSEGHRLRELACHKYSGARGSWNAFWSPEQAPLFPFFLGSQGLYSSLEDYGRFMEFWLKKGRSRQERLVRASLVRKALVPSAQLAGWPTGMQDVTARYGYLMQLWMGAADESGESELVALGHNGSDGTHAWAFPEQKAIVLYFTQSRGTRTGVRVEEVLGELFLGEAFDPIQVAPPLNEYLGYYAETERSRYQAVIRDGNNLALESPGRRILSLVYAGGDTWKVRDRPSVRMTFLRSESGEVIGFDLGGNQEFRLPPSQDLPTKEEMAELVSQTHRLDLLESLGPIRFQSTLNIEKLKLKGEGSKLWSFPNRFRVNMSTNGNFEDYAFDGERFWYASSNKQRAQLEGDRANQLALENPFSLFGGWLAAYPNLEVVQVLHDDEREVILLRTGDCSQPEATFYVDLESGRLMRRDTVSIIEGMGRVGQQTVYADFREISGMLVPFETATRIANPMIGTAVTTIEGYELGVELPQRVFELMD